ncbi:MAG: PGF-CTERM sorting domain-containing protein [Halobacterium sp.]
MRERIQALVLSVMLVGSVFAVAPAAATTGDAQEAASVTFEAQTSGGHTVTVDSVTLPDGGFVTIHDSSVNDGETFGSVVGSSAYLSPGTHENVTVKLDEPVSGDVSLVAMPHKDTDGDQVYEFVSANGAADGPYTADGGAVVDAANVTASATVSMTDQPTDGNSIVVDRVELAQPGFVAVHDSSLLDGDAFGSVVGHSQYLSAGVHEDVRIQLDQSVGNETLIPMPHRDTDGDQTYDFVSSEGGDDGPFTDMNGDAVVTTAAVTQSNTASVSAMNQTTGGHSAVVDSVFLPEGGFVTIHDGTVTQGQTFESIRGTSTYLEPGLHRDVRVALDDPYTEDGTLVPMAHKDTDGDEAYTFEESGGENDGPYTADGGAVVDTASATVSASVSIDDQQSDGHTVTVESVDLSQGGFVTVHDASLFAGQTFGSVAGTSQYLEAGHHEDVQITLDSPLNESQTVVAMAHRDTDGDEAYTFVESGGENDGPFVANGGAVVDTAKASVNAVTVISDQESDGSTVVVDSVTLADGGFVTIHDGSLTEGAVFDSVRGTSQYLAPGTHENVEIQLDSELSGETTVFAMAHRDTDGDQTYTFVESEGANDGPYVASGAPVMSSATVSAPAMTTTTESMQTTEAMDTTEMMDTTEQMDETTENESGGGAPGFGLALALVAVVGAALLALRKQ